MAILIFLVAFIFRFKGISTNHPFWVDEFSTANSAKLLIQYGLSVFNHPDFSFEANNLLTYTIVAVFFKFLGLQEWSARLPFVIIGAFVPVAVYWLTREAFDRKTAVSAAILTALSYFQITWSRQARGYVLLQSLLLLFMLIYFKFFYRNKAKPVHYLLMLFIAFAGILTHYFYLIFLACFLLYILLLKPGNSLLFLKNKYFYLALFIFLIIVSYIGFFTSLKNTISSGFISLHNNLWYYHSFLWREYSLITFTSLLGLFLAWKTNRNLALFFMIYTVVHTFFIFFLFGHYISKYLLPVFPILLICSAYTITFITDQALKNKDEILKFLAPIFITLFIVLNGHKFVIKPKNYYSVNHDFREIANIDYHRIYGVIKAKGSLEKGRTAVIDPWFERSHWYLGHDYKPYYVLRWENSGDVNKKTEFYINEEGDKIIRAARRLKLITNLKDLEKAMKKYPLGFIFIDDSTLPKDIIDYAEKNLVKELYLDHYDFDDNPYSLWPATLYSWGIKK